MGVTHVRSRPPSERPPLGGTSGKWGHRLVHFHLPIAFASAAVLLLFMTLPAFDPLAYPRMDMTSRSALPQRGAEPMPGGTDAIGHGGSGTQPPSDHGGGPAASPSGHSGSASSPPSAHGNPQASAGHGADRGEPTDPRDMTASREWSRFTQRLTVATGYVATGLLALTLLIGPANLMLRRRVPISSYLRRDVGMWTAAFGVVHVLFGFQVHSAGQLSALLAYFFTAGGAPLVNSFGLGNWTGLVATIILVGLLTISSDLALRTLKAPTWKWLQRLNYALFALVLMHALFYGALLRVSSPFTVILILGVIAVFAGQFAGVFVRRQKRSSRAPAPVAG
jgi:sulfoxide reductase heme-binding subunit YedZ